MSSPFPKALLVIAVWSAAGCRPHSVQTLRVCADPNNLPFSNQRQQGFENRIAERIASDFDARVEYTWFPQRRGFVRNTLQAGLCDVVMGVPHRYELVRSTRPYYRSSYVFLSREDRGITVGSLDDAALRTLRIGVPIVGDDYANPPPVLALARRQIISNVHGYSVFGDYSQPDPPARLVEAVAKGEVDVAIAWGPLGGYFAKRQAVPLRMAGFTEEQDATGLPFTFAIAMGVRKTDTALQERLDQWLALHQSEVDGILREYGVPLLLLR